MHLKNQFSTQIHTYTLPASRSGETPVLFEGVGEEVISLLWTAENYAVSGISEPVEVSRLDGVDVGEGILPSSLSNLKTLC